MQRFARRTQIDLRFKGTNSRFSSFDHKSHYVLRPNLIELPDALLNVSVALPNLFKLERPTKVTKSHQKSPSPPKSRQVNPLFSPDVF